MAALLLTALSALLAAEAGRAEAAMDPAARVELRPLDGERYSIRPVNHECRPSPAAGRRERLVALAEEMWIRFGRKAGRYGSTGADPGAGRATDAAIAGFWAAIPPGDKTKAQWLQWRDNPAEARGQHWSAAFTSWLMCEAGLSLNQFERSPRHLDYVLHARDRPDVAAHRVWDIGAAAPRAGDLICASGNRVEVKALRFRHPMHCFLLVRIAASEARLIGGNVDGAVAMVTARVTGSGARARLVPTAEAPWLLLMELRESR